MVQILNNDDVVIVGACRTPFSRAFKGNFKNTKLDELVSTVIKGVIDKSRIDPKKIDEVAFGHVLAPMNGSTHLRMGALRAGIPVEVPVSTVNRQCASGIESVSIMVDKIRLNKIEIGLAGGFESMTSHQLPKSYDVGCIENDNEHALGCLISLGETSEILADEYHLSREEIDAYACESQRRAHLASKTNKFKNEIVPMIVDGTSIDYDDGIRETTIEKLGSLRPVFRENGRSTAGNCSQLTDGAAAMLVMKRSKALELGLEIMGTFVDYVTVGVPPKYMGTGPIAAIPLLLNRNNLTVDDISTYEINEAFSSQLLCCTKTLKLDINKVNKYGGAIALGHPLGATGSRLICTLLNIIENNSSDNKYGVISLCVGTGMGAACLIKSEK